MKFKTSAKGGERILGFYFIRHLKSPCHYSVPGSQALSHGKFMLMLHQLHILSKLRLETPMWYTYFSKLDHIKFIHQLHATYVPQNHTRPWHTKMMRHSHLSKKNQEDWSNIKLWITLCDWPLLSFHRAGLNDTHSTVVHVFIILFTESHLNYMCSHLSFSVYCGYEMHQRHVRFAC